MIVPKYDAFFFIFICIAALQIFGHLKIIPKAFLNLYKWTTIIHFDKPHQSRGCMFWIIVSNMQTSE